MACVSFLHYNSKIIVYIGILSFYEPIYFVMTRTPTGTFKCASAKHSYFNCTTQSNTLKVLQLPKALLLICSVMAKSLLFHLANGTKWSSNAIHFLLILESFSFLIPSHI